MKLAWRIALGIAVIGIAAVAAAFFLGATQTGTAVVVRVVRPLLPASISIGEIGGKLIGPLTVSGAAFTNDTTSVTIGSARVDWKPTALFSGSVIVTSLTASDIDVVMAPPAADAEDAQPWRRFDLALPLSIKLEDLVISKVSLWPQGSDGRLIRLDSIALAGAFDAEGARVRTLRVTGPDIRVDGTMQLDPTGSWPLELAADINLAIPERDALAVNINASGNLDDLSVSLDAAPPWNIDITGRLESLTNSPAADLAVAVKGFAISTASPASPDIAVDGNVQLEGRLDAFVVATNLTLAPADGLPVAVVARAGGSMRQLDLQELTLRRGPTTLEASGRIDIADTRPVIDLTGRWQDLVLPTGDAQSAFASPTGTFRLNGGPSVFVVELHAGLADAQGAGALDIAGDVDIGKSAPAFALNGTWNGLIVPLSEAFVARSDSGQFEVGGNIDAWRYAARLDVDAGQFGKGLIVAAGTGDRYGAVVDTLQLPLLGGQIDGTATVDWRDGAAVNASLSASRLDPAAIVPDLPGQLGFTSTLTARAGTGGVEAQLEVTNLRGRLNASSVSGGIKASVINRAVNIERLDLRVGDVVLEASGQLSAVSDLRWNLVADDLAKVSPQFAGRLLTNGRWQGNADMFELSASIEARDALLFGASIGRADGKVHAETGTERDLTIGLEIEDLAVRGQRIDTLSVEVDGRVARHVGQLAMVGERGSLNLRAAGGYANGNWTGSLEDLVVIPGEDAAQWRLQNPRDLTIGAGSLSLNDACLARDGASICATANRRPDGPLALDLAIDALPLTDFASLLPPGLKYSGTLSGALRVDSAGDTATGDAELTLSAGQIEQRDLVNDASVVLLGWTDARAKAQLGGNRLTASAAFDLQDGGRMRLDALLPMQRLVPDRKAPLEASLAANLGHFALLEALVPDLAAVRGAVTVNGSVAGTLDAPRFNGQASLRDGSADLPRLGLHIAETQLTFGADGQTITLTGGATSGDGKVAFEGRFDLGDESWRGQATLAGEQFTAVSLPELTATISPDIEVQIEGRNVRVSGKVGVPSARVEPRDLTGTIQPSPDAVIVGASAAKKPAEAWAVSSNVRISFGDAVAIDAFGLTGNIEGRLVARDQPGRPTVASGELKLVDANYEAYGQKLNVERGRLIFTGGPIGNPGIDVRATRSVGDVRVGVDLRGQLSTPVTTLFSQPALGQADTLSYLVLGRPLSTVGSGDQDTLNRASVGLGLSGAEMLAQQVGRRLGLDEVSIDNGGDQSEAALVVGKYLSPKLYVSYGLGLFESFNRALLRYQFTPNFSVQTEAGIEQSADVVYTLER